MVVQGFNSTGAVTFSQILATGTGAIYNGLALDAAGNIYLTGAAQNLYHVKNSIATCGSELLSVFAPDGSLLQSTYIAGANVDAGPLIAISPNSSVFLVALPDSSFAPTQAGPFPAGGASGANFLVQLSPNANAQTVPLACLGNGASYETGSIAPGEIVTLVGSGLGPQQGVQNQATLESPYPTQTAGVAVTFDGTPAPLLWVQDSQINVVAPWSLTPGQTTQVCVSYSDVKTNCLTWPVAQTAPGVFTVDGFYAAALNQDGTLNSADNPAAPGSIVSVFATGLGPITPPQADGTLVGLPLPNNVLPVGVEAMGINPGGFGGSIVFTPLDVTYAGPAPYQVAGTSQINFKVVSGASWFSVTLPSTGSQPFSVYVTSQ
jgi:uncharacterized protein (TIGR03437 family)